MKKKSCRFINRDISWIEFNSRVLDEAADPGNPLLERLNFISIVSNNLDEFCMVRFAGVSNQMENGYKKVYKDYGYDPVLLGAELQRKIRSQVERQYRCLKEDILPQLEKHSIRIVSWRQLTASQKNTASKIMNSEIYPILTPIAIDSEHPFPLVQNLGLEILIRLVPEKSKSEKFALLEVPAVIPRFIPLENSAERLVFIPAEELICNQLNLLFSGAVIRECSCFRVTRDMDFSLDADSVSDLLSGLQLALRKRTKRNAVRLEYSSEMSAKSRKWLISQLNITPEKVLIQPIPGLLNLKSMSELASLHHLPALHNVPLPPLPVHFLQDRDIFRAIRENGPFMLHHPYLSFDPVLRMLECAADDPDVLAVKQTLYRVGGGDSPVVRALIRAARNGKQVTVLVELKARFEEQNNMNWAQELAEAGAHVVYGIAKLKIHGKALLVIRKEENGIHRYVHLSTGNYNSKTARLYTDLGYFSDDPLLVRDVSALFNVITGFSAAPDWNRLIVAPFNLREKILSMIDQEARCSTPENPGCIIIKINSLIDYEVIEHLYLAAEKNVRINLIVRGICGLTPCAVSSKAAANIRIVSIIDRFLEHSRIYYFAGNGSPQYYLGSADLMPRNLNRRVEILVPVDSPAHREELDFILKTLLADERKGRHVCGFNQYTGTLKMLSKEASRSQLALYEYYRDRWRKESGKSQLPENGFTVFRDSRSEER
ncbi:MAG: polyphosphate kinase 1 [Lentisphaeria bacterium]|nr:polyphosphate kinase 1 [Lentisphaeria bacterium]